MGQREQVAKLEMELEELMARLQEPVPNFHQSGNGFHQAPASSLHDLLFMRSVRQNVAFLAGPLR
jgi:hypothetical protein